MEKSRRDQCDIHCSGKSRFLPGPLYTVRVERADRGAKDGHILLREFKTRYRDKALEAINGVMREYIKEGVPIESPTFRYVWPRTERQSGRTCEREEWFDKNYQRALFDAISKHVSYREIDSVAPERGSASLEYTQPLINEVEQGRVGYMIKGSMETYKTCGIDKQIEKYEELVKTYGNKFNPN